MNIITSKNSAIRGQESTMIKIEKLDIEDYDKCNAIWNMQTFPYTEKFREEIESGNRIVYVYRDGESYVGEIAYVFDMNDSDYTVPNQRIYISRLIVKRECRNKGIGAELIDFIVNIIEDMGYKEISIGVDKDNAAALHLYRKKGFTEVAFDGADSGGEYYKLLRRL